ncbi:MAG: peptidase M64 [Bacteroidaceae bacterium]|nr:peptidase M64 [Bacteroidaceae bacterium]
MQKTVLSLIFLAYFFALKGQNFESNFENNTLRLDYIFAGTNKTQNVYLSELQKEPGWYGRRNNMAKLPLEGNGQITMTDAQTGDTIYRTSFSTLFQEWQTTEESRHLQKAFENTYLIPFPRREAKINVSLFDTHRRVCASMTHTVNPNDILIRRNGFESHTPYKYVMKNGDSSEKIDIVFVAEGYTEEMMPQFYADVDSACSSLFRHEPFRSMKDCFNIIALHSPSKDAEVSSPKKGKWKQTAVKSNYDTFYSDRYLTTSHLKHLHDLLAGVPYEHIIILANSNIYGGGGIYNSYTLTTSRNPKFAPVVVHEFGHSFAGLADEYDYHNEDEESPYPADTEPWEQNITTLFDFASKWADLMPKKTKVPTPIANKAKINTTTIGVYEGAGYQDKGVFRPALDCRMRTNEADAFCPVCQRAIKRLIQFYTAK